MQCTDSVSEGRVVYQITITSSGASVRGSVGIRAWLSKVPTLDRKHVRGWRGRRIYGRTDSVFITIGKEPATCVYIPSNLIHMFNFTCDGDFIAYLCVSGYILL